MKRRLHRVAVALVTAGFAVCLSAPAWGACTATYSATGSPWVVGDSVIVGIAPRLDRLGLGVDARVCRMAPEGLARWRASGRRSVVFALGTNASVSVGQLDELRRGTRELWLVTPVEMRDSYAGDAARMRRYVRQYPRVRLLDWARLSAGRPWFADAVHPNAEGQRQLVRLLASVRVGGR